MQVFGLPGHIIRNDAVARWRCAMADGLSVEAAKAVGVPRSTLYRWEKDPQPKSRRPHKITGRRWSAELACAVEAARLDNPLWGKRKIAVLMCREGLATSVSTVGRILARLMRRGAIAPVPVLRRRPEGRRIRFTAKQRYARRLPKGRKAKIPGKRVQIDTLFVNVRPDKPVKHFTAYDPVAKWTVGRPRRRRCLGRRRQGPARQADRRRPVPGAASRSMADRSSWPRSKTNAAPESSSCSSCRPSGQTLNGCVESAQSTWRYEFYAVYDLPHRLDKLQTFVDAFAHRFNHYRPHDALGGRIPAEYLKTISAGGPNPSHIA